MEGVVALPERNLTYVPLLRVIRRGLTHQEIPRLAPLTRPTPEAVVAHLLDGAALLAALPLVDAIMLAESGAPLAVVGALTRRFAGQFVIASQVEDRGGLAGLFDGQWRAVNCGLQTGANGTERALRLLFVEHEAGSVTLSPELPNPSNSLPAAGSSGAPRWIGYPTDEALVAALVDTRVDAFIGRSPAAAQSLLMGAGRVATNLSAAAGGAASEAGAAVLVARRDTLTDSRPAALLGAIVRHSAAAAAELGGPDGLTAALEALPDWDALRLREALRLDVPSAAQSVYDADGRLSPDALRRTLDLLGRSAGRRIAVDAGTFLVDLGG